MNCQDALNAVMWQENKIVLLIGELEDDLLSFVEDQFGPITVRNVAISFVLFITLALKVNNQINSAV